MSRIRRRALQPVRRRPYLLEYDTERAGDFAPLGTQGDKVVVLGMFEQGAEARKSADLLRSRIDEAARFGAARRIWRSAAMRLLERHDRPAADCRRPEAQARIDGRRRAQSRGDLMTVSATDAKAALAGQIAVVTGGAGASAPPSRPLAADGASVAVVDVNEPPLRARRASGALARDVTRPAEITPSAMRSRRRSARPRSWSTMSAAAARSRSPTSSM